MDKNNKDLELLSDFKNALINGENYNEMLEKYHEEFSKLNEINFTKIELKFQNSSDNLDPVYAKKSDSGFDLRAFIDEPITLKPLERTIIPTGLYFEIPEGFEIQIRPRSGLAAKHGITVLNTPGTIDCEYRGEIKIILVNLSSEPFIIENGERIAQAVFNSVINSTLTDLIKIDKISQDTDRASGGFGSTGTK